MKPVLQAGLSKSGICRNVARELVYAPNRFLGFGIAHPYELQGIRKLASVFNMGQSFTTKLIEESWYRTMIECRYGADYLEFTIGLAKHIITQGWISSL
jgi:hypothetical protein